MYFNSINAVTVLQAYSDTHTSQPACNDLHSIFLAFIHMSCFCSCSSKSSIMSRLQTDLKYKCMPYCTNTMPTINSKHQCVDLALCIVDTVITACQTINDSAVRLIKM